MKTKLKKVTHNSFGNHLKYNKTYRGNLCRFYTYKLASKILVLNINFWIRVYLALSVLFYFEVCIFIKDACFFLNPSEYYWFKSEEGTLGCLFFMTFIINYLMFFKWLHDIFFLYQALLIQLDLSVSVFVLLEHPTVFRENVANKNHNINFFKKPLLTLF